MYTKGYYMYSLLIVCFEGGPKLLPLKFQSGSGLLHGAAPFTCPTATTVTGTVAPR